MNSNLSANKVCWGLVSKVLYKFVDYGDDITESDFYSATYGFGYDGADDDYKLVRIDDTEISDHFNIQVYSLGSDSWGNVRKMPYCFTFPWKCDAGVFFNGALHWFGVVQETSIEVIVSFNLNNERTVEIPLPEAPLRNPGDEKFYWKKGVNVGVLEDCLCLVLVGDFWYTVDVWVLKDYGVRESWFKKFTITQDKWRYRCTPDKLWRPIWTFKNGDILANYTWNDDLFGNNHKGSLICNPKKAELREEFHISCVGISKLCRELSFS